MNSNTRLIELDFFRGAALLIIFWDHLHWFTKMGFPLHYGFSDAAAVFVFLSGYVSGLVYWKIYNLKGMKGVVLKALKRAGQIYIVHIIAVAALLVFAYFLPETGTENPVHLFSDKFAEDPFNISAGIIFLQYFPDLFDILPLYIILVSAIPPIILLIIKNWRLAFMVFFILYCAAQLFHEMNLQYYYPSWTFNPFSWIFLFASGMIISINNRRYFFNIPVKPVYTIPAIIVLTYSFLDLKTVNQLLNQLGILPSGLMFVFPSPFPLIEKDTLEPVFLIHFFSLAYLVSVLINKIRPILKTGFTLPVVILGQHSLSLFSSGIILTYIFTYLIIKYEVNQFAFYLFALAGWALTIIVGLVLFKYKKRTRLTDYKVIGNKTGNEKEVEPGRKELRKIQGKVIQSIK